MVMAPIDRLPRCPMPVPGPKPKPKYDFQKMDADKNGTISRDEFIGKPANKLEAFMKAREFAQLDKNKDGELSKFEQFIANWTKPVFHKPVLTKPSFGLKDS